MARVQDSVHIETEKMARSYKDPQPLVVASIWTEVMRLTGKRLRGVEIISSTKVQVDAGALTPEAHRRLGI